MRACTASGHTSVYPPSLAQPSPSPRRVCLHVACGSASQRGVTLAARVQYMETDFNERRQDPLLRVNFLQKEETACVSLRSPSRYSRQHQGHLAYTVEEWFNLPAYVKTRVPCPVLLEAPQYTRPQSTFEERMRWLDDDRASQEIIPNKGLQLTISPGRREHDLCPKRPTKPTWKGLQGTLNDAARSKSQAPTRRGTPASYTR